MRMISSKKWTIIYYIASILLPTAILCSAFAIGGVYPFGNKTVLMTDLYHQYSSFYGYWVDAVRGHGSLLYSWNAGFGSNFVGDIAYYAASPFLMILLLFPKADLDVGILVLILLKIGFAGLTAYFFIRRKFTTLQAVEALLFSSFYALISYTIIYYYNVMWLDGLIWLPILILATDTLIEKRKTGFFIFFLAVMFVSNFYIAYMIGIFLFLYLVTGLCVNLRRYGKRGVIGIVARFALGTVVAAAISAVLTLPTFDQLKLALNPSPLTGQGSPFPVLDFLGKLCSGVYDTVKNDGTPNLYVGLYIWMLVPFYFISKSIGLREKIRWAFLLAVLFVSMEIPNLNLAWYAGDYPQWFHYRYSFILSFTLFFISLKAYEQIRELKLWYGLALYTTVVGVILALPLYVRDIKVDRQMNIALISLFAVFLFIRLRDYRKLALVVLLLYTLADLSYNTITVYYKLTDEIGGVNRNQFTVFNGYAKTVRRLKKLDKTANYRIETDLNLTNNDPLHSGYKGISHSSSMINFDFLQTLHAFGFSTRKANYNKKGSTLFTDALFGLKYRILTASKGIQKPGYSLFMTDNGHKVYRNRYALPVGVMVPEDILDVKPSKAVNPFLLQNELSQSLTPGEQGDGVSSDLFQSLTPLSVKYINAQVSEGDGVTHLTVKNSKKPITVNYELKADGNQRLYAILRTSSTDNSKAFVNGRKIGNYPARNYLNVLDLGSKGGGKKFSLEFKIDQDKIDIDNAMFYALNIQRFTSQMNRIDKYNRLQNVSISGTRMTGTVKVNQDRGVLFLSIPWDPGWHVEVDGKSVKPKRVLGSFMGIPLHRGEYSIRLEFVPQGLRIGGILSAVGCLVFLFILWLEAFRRKRGHSTYEK